MTLRRTPATHRPDASALAHLQVLSLDVQLAFFADGHASGLVRGLQCEGRGAQPGTHGGLLPPSPPTISRAMRLLNKSKCGRGVPGWQGRGMLDVLVRLALSFLEAHSNRTPQPPLQAAACLVNGLNLCSTRMQAG